MQEFFFGLVVSALAGVLKRYSWWSTARKAAQIIVSDPANPITDPRKALEQVILLKHARDIEDGLERIRKMQASTAVAEKRALKDGISGDVVPGKPELELVERDGTEEFKPVSPPKG